MESCLHVLVGDSSRQFGSQLCCLFSVGIISCHVASGDVTGLLKGRRRKREKKGDEERRGERRGRYAVEPLITDTLNKNKILLKDTL